MLYPPPLYFRRISVPSFKTYRTVPSASWTSVGGHRSGGKLASIALRYCGEWPLFQCAGFSCCGPTNQPDW